MRYVAVDRRGPYLWVTFDRPGKLNVLHAEDLPSVIDAALLPGFVGLSKAREMILTGTFVAQETRDQIARHYERITGRGS